MFLTKEMRRQRLRRKIAFFIQAAAIEIAAIAAFASMIYLA